MTKEEAIKWYKQIPEYGTYEERSEYKEKFGAGTVAKRLWNQGEFTLGLEYGILIAIARIFDLTPDDVYK